MWFFCKNVTWWATTMKSLIRENVRLSSDSAVWRRKRFRSFRRAVSYSRRWRGYTVILARYLACESISVRYVPRLPIGIMDIWGEERKMTHAHAHTLHRRCTASKSSILRSARRRGITSGYLNLLIERYQWTRALTVPSLNSLRLDRLHGNSAIRRASPNTMIRAISCISRKVFSN